MISMLRVVVMADSDKALVVLVVPEGALVKAITPEEQEMRVLGHIVLGIPEGLM